MTVSTPESNQGNDFKKRPFVNRYKRHGNGNGNKYHHEILPHYPMPYIYYPPPSVYYPPITTRDGDLEIIMHDENTNSADFTRRSDQQSKYRKKKSLWNLSLLMSFFLLSIDKTIDLKGQLEYYFSR